jgi:Na+-transporting methylmalonyl-CoA/oxaloacetate decarboxylase gamma subunit
MATAETVLVIFLSVALLLFLLLAIVAVSIGIGILRNIKHISQRAEETTESVADIAKLVGKRVAPVAVSAVVAAALRRFKSKKE